MQNFKKGKWEISKSSDEKRKYSIYLYWLHFLASPVMVWPDCKIKCSWPHWEGEETACKWASNLLLAARLSILYQPFYWSHLFYTDLFIGWFHSIDYICPAINTTSPITQRPIRSLVGEELRVIKLLMGNKKIADSQEIETFRDNIFPNLNFVEELDVER